MSKTTVTATNQMTEQEKEVFLADRLVARLGTVNADGSVHLTPVWYLRKGGKFYLLMGTTRLHLKNIARDPRATMCIDTDARLEGGFAAGAKGVSSKCTVELVPSGQVKDWFYPEIAEVYGVADNPDYAAARDGEERIVAILTPTKEVTWDFNKD